MDINLFGSQPLYCGDPLPYLQEESINNDGKELNAQLDADCIIKCLHGSKTEEQLSNCRKMIELFKKKHPENTNTKELFKMLTRVFSAKKSILRITSF